MLERGEPIDVDVTPAAAYRDHDRDATATSAAATAITTMANEWPPRSPCILEKVRMVRLAALSISSMLIMMMSTFLRSRTPAVPIANSTAASTRKWPKPMLRNMPFMAQLPPAGDAGSASPSSTLSGRAMAIEPTTAMSSRIDTSNGNR
jgi:hypothetical protein